MTDDAWWRVPGHTPGPWAVTDYWVHGPGGEAQLVGDFRVYFRNIRINDANARLAALAPRMAAEIDRLRAALRVIASMPYRLDRPHELDDAVEAATAALSGKEPTA